MATPVRAAKLLLDSGGDRFALLELIHAVYTALER
jgi:hypothetical protein